MSRSADKKREKGINIVTINIRGLWGEGYHIKNLAGEAEIVAITATWMKPIDLELIHRISEHSSTTPIHDLLRGFCEAALNINPVMNYQMICKTCESTCQSVTIPVSDVNITTANVSTKATVEEELELLEQVEIHNNGKAIIVGEINERHSDWDTEYSTRGRQLKWATMSRWAITSSKKPTCTTINGKSTPDIFMTKGVQMRAGTQVEGQKERITGHISIRAGVVIPKLPPEGMNGIAYKKRSNKKIYAEATIYFEKVLPGLIDKI